MKSFFNLLNSDLPTKFLIPVFFNNTKFQFEYMRETLELYQKLKKLAGLLCVFPDYKEIKSIENLKNFIDNITGDLNGLDYQYKSLYGTGHPSKYIILKVINNIYYTVNMLIGVLCEMSLIESNYPFILCEKGEIIVSDPIFSLKKEGDLKINLNTEDYLEKSDLKVIDVKDTKFKNSVELIKENCKCYTCENKYTIAYIHHLFKCDELNGYILVAMHNLYFIETLLENFNKIPRESKFQAFFNFLQNQCTYSN